VKGGYTTFKTQLLNLFSRRSREPFEKSNITVLKQIDVRIPRGATVGIIGENGSGKSTLLKILTGIYSPTTGSVAIEGRVSALLELGAGFHPDFSGRENIFINGAILGLRRAELEARYEEIVRFAELADFIDEPVRTYSSGMFMRLAFAVATFVDPDVLILDEVLSVGDEHFTRKSRARMEEFKAQGKTILLVTHDLGVVEQWCDHALWIDRGTVGGFGEPRKVVSEYRQRVAERELKRLVPSETEPAEKVPSTPVSQTAAGTASEASPAPAPPAPSGEPLRWGNQRVRIEKVRLLGHRAARETMVLAPDEEAVVELHYSCDDSLTDVGFGIGIFREDGLHVYGTNTFIERVSLPSELPTRGVVRVRFERLALNEANYTLDVAAHGSTGIAYDYQKRALRFAVRSDVAEVGVVRPPHRWELETIGDAAPQRNTVATR
jgi:lipopolysaccharide transport system ATP-binding protein